MERRKVLKRDEELRNHLKLSLSDDKTKEVLKLGVEADTSRLANYFIRTLQGFRWEKVPAIFRAFLHPRRHRTEVGGRVGQWRGPGFE